MMMNNFYDTSSLLLKANNLFSDKEEKIIISSITLNELEGIKNNNNKDAEIKYSARKILHELENHPNEYQVILFQPDHLALLNSVYESNNDIKIIASALYYYHNYRAEGEFITNDLSQSYLAAANGLKVNKVIEEKYEYEGYLEVKLTNEEMTYLYSNLDKNIYNLFINQYLIIVNENDEIVDKMCWTGENLRPITYSTFKS